MSFLSDYIYFMPPLNVDGMAHILFLNTKNPSKKTNLEGFFCCKYSPHLKGRFFLGGVEFYY